LAGVSEAAGDKNGALALWTSIAQQVPRDPLPVVQQARLMNDLGQESKALERYRYVLAGQTQQQPRLTPEDEAMVYDALLDTAKKSKQMPGTVTFLKQQLAKSPDHRAAYTAILDYYEEKGDAETGRAFVKSFIDKHPKLIAPRAAIDEFDLRRAKKMLSELQKRDSGKRAPEKRDGLPSRGSTLPAPDEKSSDDKAPGTP
jgi:tetratricopeptide (TPR) repeat protein